MLTWHAGSGPAGFAVSGHVPASDPTLYCSAPPDPTTNSDPSATQHLKLSDVSLTISSKVYGPSNCYGEFLGGSPTAPAVFSFHSWPLGRAPTCNPLGLHLAAFDHAVPRGIPPPNLRVGQSRAGPFCSGRLFSHL